VLKLGFFIFFLIIRIFDLTLSEMEASTLMLTVFVENAVKSFDFGFVGDRRFCLEVRINVDSGCSPVYVNIICFDLGMIIGR
jgi:hypothetical protein